MCEHHMANTFNTINIALRCVCVCYVRIVNGMLRAMHTCTKCTRTRTRARVQIYDFANSSRPPPLTPHNYTITAHAAAAAMPPPSRTCCAALCLLVRVRARHSPYCSHARSHYIRVLRLCARARVRCVSWQHTRRVPVATERRTARLWILLRTWEKWRRRQRVTMSPAVAIVVVCIAAAAAWSSKR